MADFTKDDLKDALVQAYRQGQQTNRGQAVAGDPGMLSGLTNAAKLSGEALKGLIEGGNDFGSVLGRGGDALKQFGGMGKLAGESLAFVGKYAQESVNAMRGFSKIGASFEGDAIAMRVGIAGTRMSIEEYGKVLTKNKDLMTSMGGTVSSGARAFNEFSKEFFDNKASDNLRALGMTSEEVNGALAIELANRRFTNMQDEKSRAEAIASAEAMATEMDKIAKLTGKSREQQQEEMAALQRDGKYQAAIRVAMMNGNKFAAEGMQAAMTTMGKFGKPVEALMKDFVAYGTASKETAATMASLGPAGQQMQQAVAMVKNAKTEEQKTQAQAALAAAERAVQERLASKDFNENAALGIKGFQDVANATTNLSAGLDKVAADNNLNLSNAADRRKAVEILNRQADEEQKKQTGKTKEGVSPGKATTDAVVAFEKTMQNSSAAVVKGLVEPLNNQIAPGMKKFADFLNSPELSRANQEKKLAELRGDIETVLDRPGTVRENVERARQNAAGQAAAGDQARQEAQAAGQSPAGQRANEAAARARERESAQRAENPLSGLGGLFTETPGRVTIVGPTRDTTTLGATGMPFEPQDFFGKVAKGEAVLSPQQLTNMFMGARDTGLKDAVGALSSMTKEGPAAETGLKDIMGSLSSMTKEGPAAETGLKDIMGSLSSMTKEGPAGGGALPEGLAGGLGLSIPNFSTLFKTPITDITESFTAMVDQTNEIAEQTKPLVAAKKDYASSELKLISEELSNLGDQRAIQSIREEAINLDIQSLNENKELLDNNQKLAIKDLTETNDAIAAIRARIDQSDDAAEVTKLQEELAQEENIKTFLEKDIARREQRMLDNASDIALKEQELLDLKEEAADTEAEIQEKKIELLNTISDFDDDQLEATDNAFDEFAGLDTAIAANQADDEARAEMARESRRGTPATAKESPSTGSAYSSMLDKFFGPMSEPSKASAGVDAVKASVAQAGDEESKAKEQQAKAMAAAEKAGPDKLSSTKESSKPTTPGGKDATLNDVVASLSTLNKQVGVLNSEIAKLPSLMEKSVKATSSLNGNLNVR